ncbi:MAG: ERAP1-like C-terminal domain-containing protein, partial [Micromonospora sp.]
LAHMWFGDLVTMRWWNDLWLNESFAEWASHWCNTHATRFSEAWTTFLSIRKNWGYRQDQLSSTHPVYCEMPDLEAVEVNFDGITYAKGASVLKQLVAYVGEEPFLAGLRAYFGKHAWGNATFDDLLSELEAASGRELRKFAAQWLETAQVNTLRPEVTIGADSSYERVVVRQEAPAGHPTLRTHRIGVGLYDLADGRLVRRERIEVDVTGEQTEASALHGQPAADVLLLNDDDLTYTKLRLDERSMATVVQHIAGFESSLARALCWTAAWDMTRDAELAALDYVALVLAGLPAETDINLVTATLRQATTALTFYADPAWAPTGWAELARTAKTALAAAEPGSGFQLAWARAYASAARSGEDLAILRGWLNGGEVPAGLTVDTELRWTVLQALVANGAAGTTEVDAELAKDRTASGEREAAYAYALVPTPENKAAVWAQLTGPEALPNWRHRALLQGFAHPAQVELVAPYREKYFEAVGQVWASRDSEPAQEFTQLAYPAYLVEDETVAATDGWLAGDGHPAPLRRLVAEGRDGVVRALKARAKDAQSA